MNSIGFKDKVCIITGSTQGLGREMARLILHQGGQVVINGRKADRAAEVTETFKEFENRYIYSAGDVSIAADAIRIVNDCIEKFGRLDVLINNGGMSAYGDLEHSTPQVIAEVINSNLMGSLLITHFAIPYLKQSKGSVEFISSLAAIHGLGGYTLYSASKMAYIGATQGLRKELHDSGVHVGVMYLGFTKNDESKQTLNASGKLEKVPVRKGLPVSSQTDSAAMILNQIIKRKPVVVHGAFGKVTHYLNRLSPGLIHRILLNTYKKQKKS